MQLLWLIRHGEARRDRLEPLRSASRGHRHPAHAPASWWTPCL